jgi:type IV secretory pathway ATPase VirB11/archaellum biosynthesis ATPase
MNPAEPAFSDPSFFEFLPFPSSLPMPFQRFESDYHDIPNFRYMGRRTFLDLYTCAQGRNFLKSNERLYLYGSAGSGKSHILAALAFQLIREGKRVAYIPDCRELLTNPENVLRVVLLNAFPDEMLAIKSAPDPKSLLNFWDQRVGHYLIVDQMNALEVDSETDEYLCRKLRL